MNKTQMIPYAPTIQLAPTQRSCMASPCNRCKNIACQRVLESKTAEQPAIYAQWSLSDSSGPHAKENSGPEELD